VTFFWLASRALVSRALGAHVAARAWLKYYVVWVNLGNTNAVFDGDAAPMKLEKQGVNERNHATVKACHERPGR
jgi:hypothetical protein